MSVPALNALFNFIALCLTLAGLVAAHRKKFTLHRYLMMSAILASCGFLIGYLYYHAFYHAKVYTGAWGIVYYPILVTHIVLAALVPFLVLRMAYLGVTSQFEKHKKLARWTVPIWLYVSSTGIIIFFMIHF